MMFSWLKQKQHERRGKSHIETHKAKLAAELEDLDNSLLVAMQVDEVQQALHRQVENTRFFDDDPATGEHTLEETAAAARVLLSKKGWQTGTRAEMLKELLEKLPKKEH